MEIDTTANQPVVSRMAQSLLVVSFSLECVAVVAGVVGVGIGMRTALERGDGSSRPYVILGFAIAVGSLVAGLWSWCIARAIGLFAVDTATRNGADLWSKNSLGRTILASKNSTDAFRTKPSHPVAPDPFDAVPESNETFDFGEGPVPAHRHPNLGRKLGGWIANTARVSRTATVDSTALVYGTATVCDFAQVYGNARVYGSATVSGNANVCGNAHVCGDARISGSAQVSGDLVYSTGQIGH